MIARPQVKVCGITTCEDAQLALDAGADWLGVIVWPGSPRAVGYEQARELCQYIPAGRRVMVDVQSSAQELERHGDLGFDAFQLHLGAETGFATLAAWSGLVGREALWLGPRVPPGEPFPQEILEFADTVVVDTFDKNQHGGTGRTGDWVQFAEWQTLYQHKHWVLAGGLGPDNVRAALQATRAERIDVNSGVESAPGRKDPAKLRALFRALLEV